MVVCLAGTVRREGKRVGSDGFRPEHRGEKTMPRLTRSRRQRRERDGETIEGCNLGGQIAKGGGLRCALGRDGACPSGSLNSVWLGIRPRGCSVE